MARVLLVPHAPTSGLAHVGACLAVGAELRARGHEIEMAYGGALPELAEREGFAVHRVPEVAPSREWEPSGWFSSTAELVALVREHLAVLERFRPDAAVTSSGIAGRLALELAGVPQLHLMHYLPGTRYGRRAIVWDDRLRDARHPRRLARVLRARARRMRHRRPPHTPAVVEAARRELGLPPAGPDAIGGCQDSLVALTTAPFLDPASGLPEHWRYAGPVTWSAGGELPDRGARRGAGRPLVYVTQGSTGKRALLERAVRELAAEPLDLLVSTAGLCDPADVVRIAPNARAARLLPGRACLEAADVAVIHGGHLTLSDALVSATPVVITPFRRDQVGNVNRVERLGAGVGVWPAPVLGAGITRAVRKLLTDPRYASRSREIAGRLRNGWGGAHNAADMVEGLVA